MIFEGFNFFDGLLDNNNALFDEIINKILTFLPYVKYIVGTILLILGILMFLTKAKYRNENSMYYQAYENQKKSIRPTKFIGAIVCIILALGFYFDFLLVIIYSITKLEPPMLFFTIISMVDIVEIPAMVLPLTPVWYSLTHLEQLILLMIGIVSMAGFLLFICGTILILGQGFHGKHNGIKLVVPSIIILFMLGISPGISLLI